MNESIRLKNNKFWDSTGVMHNKEKISEILNEKIYTEITLFEGSSTAVTCTESPTTYDRLIINYQNTWDSKQYGTLILDNPIDGTILSFFTAGNVTENFKIAKAKISGTTIKLTNFSQVNNNKSWSTATDAGSFVITKVIGLKKGA